MKHLEINESRQNGDYSGHKNVVNFYMQKGTYPKSRTRDLELLLESKTRDPGPILWVRPGTRDQGL